MSMRAAVSCVDITPPIGLMMVGFAARTGPSLGTHDALTVRAVVVNDTAMVVVDVIGIHEDMSLRIRERCGLPADNVVIAALHTHGGPASMKDRAGGGTDPDYLIRLENACVQAIDQAAKALVPVRLKVGKGKDPDIARNRRHKDGLLDKSLPVLSIETLEGKTIAVLVSYACHPVVLSADNRLWTADYPHYVRSAIEEAVPGALSIFLTGCVGDANTGHSSQASLSLAANADRTYERAERIGRHIATCALATELNPVQSEASASNSTVSLSFERREQKSADQLLLDWHTERPQAEPIRALMLDHWMAWAKTAAKQELNPWTTRVSLLDWGGVKIIALPGEIFAETSLAIRRLLNQKPSFVIGFSDANAGYIPPASEYSYGGYEIDEAHRYYGMPASFKSGSAEALVAAVDNLMKYQVQSTNH